MLSIHFSFTTVVDEMRLKLISAPTIGCIKALQKYCYQNQTELFARPNYVQVIIRSSNRDKNFTAEWLGYFFVCHSRFEVLSEARRRVVVPFYCRGYVDQEIGIDKPNQNLKISTKKTRVYLV